MTTKFWKALANATGRCRRLDATSAKKCGRLFDEAKTNYSGLSWVLKFVSRRFFKLYAFPGSDADGYDWNVWFCSTLFHTHFFPLSCSCSSTIFVTLFSQPLNLFVFSRNIAAPQVHSLFLTVKSHSLFPGTFDGQGSFLPSWMKTKQLATGSGHCFNGSLWNPGSGYNNNMDGISSFVKIPFLFFFFKMLKRVLCMWKTEKNTHCVSVLNWCAFYPPHISMHASPVKSLVFFSMWKNWIFCVCLYVRILLRQAKEKKKEREPIRTTCWQKVFLIFSSSPFLTFVRPVCWLCFQNPFHLTFFSKIGGRAGFHVPDYRDA